MDGARQFRMDEGSIAGQHGGEPHVNFETIDANGDVIANNHVPLK